jgi:hypothetical protein
MMKTFTKGNTLFVASNNILVRADVLLLNIIMDMFCYFFVFVKNKK